jgi:hypothetical protein
VRRRLSNKLHIALSDFAASSRIASRAFYEIALIDCSVKVFTQRSLLGGKPARDKTRGVFPHYVTVGDPIDDQNRPNRKQDEDTDAHDERRQQPECGLILRQMILAAMLSLDAMVAQLGYEFHYGNQRSRYRNRLVGEQA